MSNDLYFYTNEHTLSVNTLNKGFCIRTMYDKVIKIHKGVDNNVSFTLKDKSNRKVDVTNHTVVFNLINAKSKKSILQKSMTKVNALSGKVSLSILARELNSLSEDLYSYTVFLADSSNNTMPVYTDLAGYVEGTIQLETGYYPGHQPTQEVTNFTVRNSKNYSDNFKGNENHKHTIAIYSTNFTGTVQVQGNLDIIASTNDDDWFPIPLSGGTKSLSFSAESGVNPFVFTCSSPHIRVEYVATSGTVDKVLLRS